jgi:hypothetical protein
VELGGLRAQEVARKHLVQRVEQELRAAREAATVSPGSDGGEPSAPPQVRLSTAAAAAGGRGGAGGAHRAGGEDSRRAEEGGRERVIEE